MLVMTTKIDWKKLAIVAAAVLLGTLGLVLLLGGGDAEAASANFADNSARVEFLQGFGWEVETTPAQSSHRCGSRRKARRCSSAITPCKSSRATT